METYKTSENMRLFFERLLKIKSEIEELATETDNKELLAIYNEFDKILKEKDNK